ncbi:MULTISPECIES: TrmH family RNA methyltransferase [Kocuria]|uniref:TrmH family RNA methyltransferase n=1 Tax=Kocuria TaxID=57493 RepID=UPI0021A80200|nr:MULTISPECIES: RNA methyltransferase [Kocuria]MCT1545504.1 RNA methyltransferase [Kocuria rhizophila]MCT2170874.1 RNA methyltransferase [Kocuria rhizophila]MDN3462123.1 RNA methyltransferase [Kocuria sp. APC 4018]
MTSPAPLSERLVQLSDPADPRVADYTSLTDVSLRRKLEPERGLYLAESSKVLRRALDAGHRPRSFFMAEKWVDGLRDVLESHDVPVYVGTDEVLEQITGFHLHRGAMAAMHRPAPLPLESVLASARRVAILEDIVDHTNVGAIFRSAAALDVDAVLVTPRCADPLYRRAVRVSMGTVFQVPWVRLEHWTADLQRVKDAGFLTAALALSDDAVTVDALAAEQPEKLALVLGTEGQGLGAATLHHADRHVVIPMSHGVDSLNVAAASAVAFWETRPR